MVSQAVTDMNSFTIIDDDMDLQSPHSAVDSKKEITMKQLEQPHITANCF